MLGLALEGGGARGAFHIGVMQACTELGMHFDAIAGTSIGAINGAMFAQGDFEAAKAIWKQITTADLFSSEDERFLELVRERKLTGETLHLLHERLKATLAGGGVDTTRMRETFEKHVNIDRLLKSPIDFGLVTVSLPDFKPVELFKDQMEPNTLLSYIMASATFPGFEQTEIGSKKYIDGGVYDNCPINMLAERGCDRVVAVRTYAIGITRPIKSKKCQVITIAPSESIGHIMHFDPVAARRNINLGYYDAMRVLKELYGKSYYLSTKADARQAFDRLVVIDDAAILKAAKACRIAPAGMNGKRLLFERILPFIAGELKLGKGADYGDIVVAMLENRGTRCGLERMKIYSVADFFAAVRAVQPKTVAKSTLLVTSPDEAIDVLISSM